MAGSAPGRGATLRSFVVVTGSTLLSGLLNALLIALAARRGETDEIAAFIVMTAVLAIVGVASGGGSGMLYLTGTEDERRAVRSQKVLAVFPALVLAALAAGAFYHDRGYSALALAAAALVFIGNNFAELPLAQLYRDTRFLRIAAPTYLSKAGAIVAFVAGAPLTMALLVGAAVNVASLELLAGRSSSLRALWNDRPTVAAARRAFGSGRGLYVYTVSELYALRVPSIGLSLVVPVTVMGAFGAVAAAYQALLSVFQSGLLMVASLRARRRLGLDQNAAHRRDAELLSLGGGILCAMVVVAVAPWLTTHVLQLRVPESSTWLQILGLSIPFVLFNRILATNAIGDARYPAAARIAVSLAAMTTVSLAIAIPLLGVTGGVLATLCAEGVVAGALLARRLPSVRGGQIS
ncbi:MAG: hypothetical protein ACRDRP_03920 [Pseudonocardiaceae bacterium]